MMDKKVLPHYNQRPFRQEIIFYERPPLGSYRGFTSYSK